MNWEPPPLMPEAFFDESHRFESECGGPFEAVILPLQDLVVYPQMVIPLHIERNASLEALHLLDREGWPLVVATQKDANLPTYPKSTDLYAVGCEVTVIRSINLPDGSASVVVQASARVRITHYIQEEPYLVATVEGLSEEMADDALSQALARSVLTMFERIVELDETLPEETYIYAMNVKTPGELCDLVAQVLDLETDVQQNLLETVNVNKRLQKTSSHLAQELDVLELESRIQIAVQEEVDKSQREYFLREQLRAIQEELGEKDAFAKDLIDIRKRLEEKRLPDPVRKKAEEELQRLSLMTMMTPDAGIIRSYLDWMLTLPWQEETADDLDLAHAKRVLESRHYGLPKAKERILEYIAVRKIAPDQPQTTILCFVGPPGTGKTSLGRSIAEALGREFVRISLGGIRDEAEIRGHRRTYIGALPGRILQTMQRAGSINPVFMLDEVDKIGADFRGDPASALLEVLDPEQNNAFSDHYLELDYDLSKVFFIATANVLDWVPEALEDRMEVIEFPGYTESEKIEIGRRFLIPRQIERNGLSDNPPRFPLKILQTLIRQYTYESGVRNFEREIAHLCRKAALRIAEGKQPIRTITQRRVEQYLGPPQFVEGRLEEEDLVGVSMGLAWTPNGGDLLPVEVALTPGKDGLKLTGQLGDVMQESAQAALTYLKAHIDDWGLSPEELENYDIHIHLPEGAIPKDGPSGGITIATALFSAFTGRPVYHTVAMTGEITLRGRVLPVGGLKEKLLAAHRAGVTRVILPVQNEKDLPDIPSEIKQHLELVLVETMDEVLEQALNDQKPDTKSATEPT